MISRLYGSILVAVSTASASAAVSHDQVNFYFYNGITSPPSINAQGRVAFSVQSGSEIWSDAGGTMELVASSAQQQPGTTSNYSWGNINHTTAISDGGLVFVASSGGVSVGAHAPLSRLIAPATVNGMPTGVSFGGFSYAEALLTNSRNTMLGRTDLTGSGITYKVNSSAVATVFSDGTGRIIAQEGAPVPSVGSGRVFDHDNFVAVNFSMNDRDVVAFTARTVLPQVSRSAIDGIWTDDGSSLSLVARSGLAIPGVSGALLGSFGRPRLNNAGDLVFASSVEYGTTNYPLNTLLYRSRNGSLQTLSHENMPAPGTTATFGQFSKAALDASGKGSVRASLKGSSIGSNNDIGVWTFDQSGIGRLLIREGDQAPGGSLGEKVFTNDSGELVPVRNANGITAVEFQIAGKSVRCIAALNDDGSLARLIRSGDTVEVFPGVFKTISSVSICKGDPEFEPMGSGGEDGFRTCLNDSNQLTYSAYFTDGSGAVLTTQVPEPSVLGTASIIVIATGMRVKRK